MASDPLFRLNLLYDFDDVLRDYENKSLQGKRVTGSDIAYLNGRLKLLRDDLKMSRAPFDDDEEGCASFGDDIAAGYTKRINNLKK